MNLKGEWFGIGITRTEHEITAALVKEVLTRAGCKEIFPGDKPSYFEVSPGQTPNLHISLPKGQMDLDRFVSRRTTAVGGLMFTEGASGEPVLLAVVRGGHDRGLELIFQLLQHLKLTTSLDPTPPYLPQVKMGAEHASSLIAQPTESEQVAVMHHFGPAFLALGFSGNGNTFWPALVYQTGVVSRSDVWLRGMRVLRMMELDCDAPNMHRQILQIYGGKFFSSMGKERGDAAKVELKQFLDLESWFEPRCCLEISIVPLIHALRDLGGLSPFPLQETGALTRLQV